jgi:hypothetical protein
MIADPKGSGEAPRPVVDDTDRDFGLVFERRQPTQMPWSSPADAVTTAPGENSSG